MTQEQLAEKAGLRNSAISALENDPEKFPRMGTVGQIAEAFGITTEELLIDVEGTKGARRKRLKNQERQNIYTAKMTIMESVASDPLTDNNTPTEESYEIHVFATTPARISIEAGVSYQMADDEWRRFDVRIEEPCYKERTDATMRRLIEKADSLVRNRRNLYVEEKAERTQADGLAFYSKQEESANDYV